MFVPKKSNSLDFCKFCELSKLHKQTFILIHTRLAKPFDLLYMDLLVSPIISCNGNKYFLSIVDYSTLFGYFLWKTKMRHFFVLVYFRNMIERVWYAYKGSFKLIMKGNSNMLSLCLKKRVFFRDLLVHIPLNKMVLDSLIIDVLLKKV